MLLVSHRYPGLEYYTEKIKAALPGVSVDVTLMQAPDAIQPSRLSRSERSAQMDLVWADNVVLAPYAKSGGLEPLDDLWAKHEQEFNLEDISPTLVKRWMFERTRIPQEAGTARRRQHDRGVDLTDAPQRP